MITSLEIFPMRVVFMAPPAGFDVLGRGEAEPGPFPVPGYEFMWLPSVGLVVSRPLFF